MPFITPIIIFLSVSALAGVCATHLHGLFSREKEKRDGEREKKREIWIRSERDEFLAGKLSSFSFVLLFSYTKVSFEIFIVSFLFF